LGVKGEEWRLRYLAVFVMSRVLFLVKGGEDVEEEEEGEAEMLLLETRVKMRHFGSQVQLG
jgi:hypothetical protein